MQEVHGKYGSCCNDLKRALEFEYEPLMHVADNGALYMAVGYTVADGDEVGWFDQAVLYCPFCGTQLITREELANSKRPS